MLLVIIFYVYISQKLFFSRSFVSAATSYGIAGRQSGRANWSVSLWSFISAFASSLVMVFTSVVTKSLISSVAMGAFVGSGR